MNEFDYDKIRKVLYNNIDIRYRDFSKRLIFTKYNILGVRTPVLRSLAKEISKYSLCYYLDNYRCDSYEEVMLFGFVIGYIKDVNLAIEYFSIYIEKIDNWALCDQVVASMKIVRKNKDVFYKLINKYLKSKNEYIVRTGLILFLDYYIEEDYLSDIFYFTENLKREEYYINMAVAWLLSICFIKYRDYTFNYLKESKLDKFTYNKTISKICDSYRVSDSDKSLLRSMRKVND